MSNASEVVRDWKDNKGFVRYHTTEDRKWRNDEFQKFFKTVNQIHY